MERSAIIKILLAALILFLLWKLVQNRRRQQSMDTYNPFIPQLDSLYQSFPSGVTGLRNRPVVMSPPGGPAMAPMGTSVDLLPRPQSQGDNFGSEFAPKSLSGMQLLSADKYIGVDTQGSSLRNASWDLRSEPPIPKRDVGPWANSTIEADLYRKPLDC